MKRLVLFLCLSLFMLTGCRGLAPLNAGSEKLQITASLFPQYDFAKAIAGDKAEVLLLLPPGSESHSYEPSPADVIAINESDLFLYTGNTMEGWATGLIDSLQGNPLVLDLSLGLSLHSHQEHGHSYDVDPHIFTSPVLAAEMANKIRDALCTLDPENTAFYHERAEILNKDLAELDKEFRSISTQAKDRPLVFGGRFAFGYFVEEYGFSYEAAYDSCSAETEPSAARLAALIEKVRNENLPVVYYEELSNPKTARLICEETGAKPLLLHSCHNISKEELARGETYISLMKQNLKNLKEGLR